VAKRRQKTNQPGQTAATNSTMARAAPALNTSERSARPLPARPSARRRPQQRSWLGPAIAAAVVVLIVAGGLYYFLGRPAGTAAPAADAAVIGTQLPDEGRTHVAEGSPITYKNTPPSSGPHFPSPKPWGVYDQPVEPGYFVHNMEHGGVVVLYDCPSGCADVVSALQNAYNTFPKDKYGEVKMVVSPYSGLPNGAKVAALAWDYRLLFTNDFDVQKLLGFYKAHADNNCPVNGPFIGCAPEDIP